MRHPTIALASIVVFLAAAGLIARTTTADATTAVPFFKSSLSTTTTPEDPPEPPTTTDPIDPPIGEPAKPPKPTKPEKPKPRPTKENKQQKEARQKNQKFSRLSRASLADYEIPLFLLPIYQSCGNEYGVPWTVLASINKTETAFGTNLNVSTAGAEGWMQFMPSAWDMYGLDANGDGKRDPYNPVDAVCAAARYLKAAGWSKSRHDAVWSYNHADWYVQEILDRASLYNRMPDDLMLALSGLASAPRYPLAAPSRVLSGTSGAKIITKPGAPLVAPNDAKIVELSGKEGTLVLLDDWGNRYSFRGLKNLQKGDVIPPGKRRSPIPTINKSLLHHLPNPGNAGRSLLASAPADYTSHLDFSEENVFVALSRLGRKLHKGIMELKPPPPRPREGNRVRAGEKLAEVGASGKVQMRIRPSGKRSPLIAPGPVLEGWRMLERTGFYRRSKRDRSPVSVFLLTQSELEARVLRDPKLDIYQCGRQDIRTGQIDRRVLALLAYLSSRGWELGISSLKCGHSYYAASGNVSNHSHGGGVDISVLNGEAVYGHQQPGSYTEQLLHTILRLQGVMHPDELISLWDLPGDTSFALSDHDDHVHVGYGSGTEKRGGGAALEIVRPRQWHSIVSRLRAIPQPRLRP